MRKTAVIAGVFSCALIFIIHSGSADAASPVTLAMNESPSLLSDLAKDADKDNHEEKEASKEEKPKPEVVRYTVKKGDSLTKVAKSFDTTWERLFYKNTEVSHPDQINPGDELVIPEKDEQLKERALPQTEQVVASPAATSTPADSVAQSARVSYSTSASSAGNRYVRGYCTWYVKNRRPDLPNNLGNAISWVANAAAQGYATGSTPRVGAVGQQGNHVVYVESVHGNGTVTVSEMNWSGWNVVNSRTVSASTFRYIY